jgi:metallophosphoesterase (TIGR03767 family)
MRAISRRQFLRLAGGTAAAASFARVPLARAAAAGQAGSRSLTTLGQTIVRGSLLSSGANGNYYRLAFGPGEPFIVRSDLGPPSTAPIALATSFVHYTDIHLIDAQSPARVEFLDRYADQECSQFPLNAAQRPHETLTLQVLELMNRRVRKIGSGPATGARLRFAVCTGDNIDNEQLNELRWFVDLMDGGKTVAPNSGDLTTYEGVQAVDWGDTEYWHPDGGVGDKYKALFGFPDYPGLLGDAVKPFAAKGIGLPWWQTYVNHDGLLQGNAPRNEGFNAVAVGPLKFDGPPSGLTNPCDPWQAIFSAVPTHPVTADPNRRIVRRHEYIDEMFNTTGTPVGHGFSQANRTTGLAYYVRDDLTPFRFISLDTVNPGGYSEGSIGAAQFTWLEQRLIEASGSYFDSNGNVVTTGNKDRLIVLFSHHGLRSLTNPLMDPDPDPLNAAANDLPRVLADQIETLAHRFPNVIAWVNGHTHNNVIEARPDPSGRTAGFWDIGTAAHVDWSSQARIVEIAVRRDGHISIFCSMVDHDARPDPRGATGLERLGSINRELSANDFQFGYESKGRGLPEDRNVELVLAGPAWVRTLAK